MSRLAQMKYGIVATLVDRARRLFENHYHRVTGHDFFRATRNAEVVITFRKWFWQRIMRRNSDAYWPVHPSTKVIAARKVVIGRETSPGWSSGCEIDGRGGISIGDFTQLAPNVRLLSASGPDHDAHDGVFGIEIGAYCLLGMNVEVHHGVTLGDFTIVGSNCVVKDSFPDGHCIVVGNPARVVGHLHPAECRRWGSPQSYVGYHHPNSLGDLRGRWIEPDLFDRTWGKP